MRNKPKIGVALSGGGIRGLAHLGVLAVMEEHHIPVDYLAGTSMGGILAGVYAAGVPLDAITEFAMHVGLIDLASRDSEFRGLFGHDKFARLLSDLIGRDDLTFEDLRIPVAVIAADVETGATVVLDSGPLIPALMATSSFPIVFAPYHYQGRWLIDGGVVNNFPVDLVRRMGADRVLGVETPAHVCLALHRQENQDKPTKRLSTRGIFAPFSNLTHDWKLPLLVAEVGAGHTIQAVNQMRLKLTPPDVLLSVHMHNVGTFATDKSEQVVELGRKVAMENLRDLKSLTHPLPPRWIQRGQRFWRRVERAWRVFQEPEYPMFPEPEGWE